MATTSCLEGIQGATFDKEGQNSFTLRYLVKFDTAPTSPYAAIALAQAATPDPVPALRANYPGQSNIFVASISKVPRDGNRSSWYYDVQYAVPGVNDGTPSGQDPNPTLRPGTRNIEYIASEYVIQQAKNTVELSHGDGNGGSRAGGTLGPIVNAAGKRPDEPLVDTEYNGVLVFEKNYANLGQIDTLNKTYQRTTNSAAIFGYEPRRLKYLVTESIGQQFEGEQEYWPGVTRVEIKKTTDLILDNVGYDYWVDEEFPATGSNLKRAKDKDGELMAEPINLTLDGKKGGTHTSTITYRYLDEVDYQPLFAS